MSLPAGARLGPYEIVSPLGAGGMGEVYRARDARLSRDVAIKILPEAFAADPERLVRFQREAQVLASLNHPHIAAIYGLEETDGRRALVLELVEGETLADRIARGPLPVDEALDVARQIADALEAAHERGIVHRDLKPANVKLTPGGKVKVLDFGLAKALSGESSSPDVTKSPTLTAAATQAGVVIGTAAYMSPEQARGKSVDRRADIWAFGAVLYEMLTGRKAFEGDTISDTLAAVLMREPDWSALPAGVPASVRRVLRRCLDRDPRTRFRDVADARIEMDEVAAAEPVAPLASPRPARRGAAVLLVAGGVLLGALATYLATRPKPPAPAPVKRFFLGGLQFIADVQQTIVLSPDGSKLAYRGRSEDGFERIYVRAFDSLEAKPLPGTEQGGQPFFSPDAQWVGFFAGGQLKKAAISGGSAQTICAVSGRTAGGTWLPDGTIVFVGDPSKGLERVPAAGGGSQLLLPVDRKKGESQVFTPWALPGGKAILYTSRTGEENLIKVTSIERPEPELLAKDGTAPIYVPTGHVLFHQGNSILALPFDLNRLAATGAAFPVLSQVSTRINANTRIYGVSPEGTLVYLPQASGETGTLVWVDRTGVETVVVDMQRPVDSPRVSPDGRRVGFRTPATNCDLWIYDLERGATTRLTVEGDNHGFVWAPDGRRVAFSRAGARGTLLTTTADGGGPVDRLLEIEGGFPIPSSWSPDGRFLLHEHLAEDVALLTLEGDLKSRPLLRAPFQERQAAFSPDGRHIAYASNESGRNEVYVQPFPSMATRTQVSSDGGVEPVWSRDGKELFFRQGRRMMAVEIQTEPQFAGGRPRRLFEGDYRDGTFQPGYDVSPDGKRFLMVRGQLFGGGEVNIVLNWLEEVERAEARVGSR